MVNSLNHAVVVLLRPSSKQIYQNVLDFIPHSLTHKLAAPWIPQFLKQGSKLGRSKYAQENDL
jgi:hypothetical protein